MERLPILLKMARTGSLPTVHRQCSHSAPEPITDNVLTCALGVDVTQCPILAGIYAEVADHAARVMTQHDGTSVQLYDGMTAEDGDVIAAQTCAWHIFTESQKRGLWVEGYVSHKGDTMYEDRLAASFAGE